MTSCLAVYVFRVDTVLNTACAVDFASMSLKHAVWDYVLCLCNTRLFGYTIEEHLLATYATEEVEQKVY